MCTKIIYAFSLSLFFLINCYIKTKSAILYFFSSSIIFNSLKLLKKSFNSFYNLFILISYALKLICLTTSFTSSYYYWFGFYLTLYFNVNNCLWSRNYIFFIMIFLSIFTKISFTKLSIFSLSIIFFYLLIFYFRSLLLSLFVMNLFTSSN
jgi:hypothetical protein